MTKKIFLLFLTVFLLVSCGKQDTTDEDDSTAQSSQKQDFFIETQQVADFPRQITISKTGILEWASSISVNAQASGQVSAIHVQEGDEVSKGQLLVSVADSIASYGLAVEAASNSLEATQLNYEQTELTLNKAITDAQIAHDKAVLDLEDTRESAKEQIAQAERNLENTNPEENIRKAQLDLDNLARTNEQTLAGFERTFTNELTKLEFFLLNTIDSVDQILGVTTTYKNDNDSYEDFLGARNTAVKNQAEAALKELISSRNTFESHTFGDNLEENVNELENMYTVASKLLNLMEQTLIYTIPSTGFDATDIATARATIDGLQVTHQTNSTTLISFLNSAKSFLATYEADYEAKKQAFDLLVEWYQTGEGNAQSTLTQAKSGVAQQIRAAETLVENTNNALQNAIKSRDITLKQLQNQINAAQIQLSQASVQAGKLAIRSPISGTIGAILIDAGEEVWPGKPAVTLSSRDTQFMIQVDRVLAQNLEPGQDVTVTYRGEESTGTITSVSSVADQSLNYSVRIKVDTSVDFLGDFIEAKIPFQSENIVVPLQNVRIISQSQWQVWVYDSSQGVVQKNVVLGNIWWDVVEIVSGLASEDQLITTDMTNYNADDFTIQVQNKG